MNEQQRAERVEGLTYRQGLADLNAAQIDQINRAIGKIVEQLKLRQWCIEQAVAVVTNAPRDKCPDTVSLAREMFMFVIPAQEEA